jgi:CRP-like cAMP-binding protein
MVAVLSPTACGSLPSREATVIPAGSHNRLLAVLPPLDRERLHPFLEPVRLPRGKVLHESSTRVNHVYFPTTAIVALLQIMTDGATGEIALVGNDGLVGIASVTGAETTHNRAVVQSEGYGYRLKADVLRQEFARGGAMQKIVLRYMQALMTQIAQTAICNRRHSLQQQLCRWLLLSLDRLPSSRMHMTQELIANILGVRREGVSDAAGRLKAAGIIQYSRGEISVLDRAGLEGLSCECYAAVRGECERLLGIPVAGTPRSEGAGTWRFAGAAPFGQAG